MAEDTVHGFLGGDEVKDRLPEVPVEVTVSLGKPRASISIDRNGGTVMSGTARSGLIEIVDVSAGRAWAVEGSGV